MRVVSDALRRARNTSVFEQPDGALAGLGRRDRQMRANGFLDLPTHRVERVERGQRVLENGTDALAPDVPHLRMVQVVDALAFQQDLPAGNAPRRLQQADDGGTRQRLAGTGLPHHTEDFARLDGKGNVVERTQGAPAVREFDDQIADFEQGGGHGHDFGGNCLSATAD